MMIDSVISWLECHDKLSGWAQLVASVVAVAITFWISRRDLRERKLIENRASLTKLENVHGIIELCQEIFSDFNNGLTDEQHFVSFRATNPDFRLMAIENHLANINASTMSDMVGIFSQQKLHNAIIDCKRIYIDINNRDLFKFDYKAIVAYRKTVKGYLAFAKSQNKAVYPAIEILTMKILPTSCRICSLSKAITRKVRRLFS